MKALVWVDHPEVNWLDSALGRGDDPTRALQIPEARCWVGRGVNHLDLLSTPEVYRQLRGWLGE